MRLSIIVPAYNEAKTIRKILETLEKINLSPTPEIIVVNDGSTDGTQEILNHLPKDKYKISHHPRNLGKGAALQTGFQQATGEVILIQDADLEYDPRDIPRVIQPILNNQADVVLGSRFVGDYPHRALYFWHYLGNKIITLLSNIFTNLNLTDVETGYKAFRRSLIKKINLQEKGFGIEVELIAKLARQNCRIFEVGIAYTGRTYQQGKKITAKDGLWALWCILKYNILTKY